MLVNSANLDSLRVGFQTSFMGGLGIAPSQYARVATTVPTTTKESKYGWLGKIPQVREWIGPRAMQNLQEADYTIKNKSWELTIAVDRDDVEDDNLGIYTPMFTEMGRSTGAHYDNLVFALLKIGFSTLCYDGQYYFDTDHPVLDATGTPQSVANTDGGSGAPWFLIDGSRALKPVILQKRKEWQFVPKDRPDDDNVFDNKEFRYGADARCNVGYGFWQFAWGSKQALDHAHYSTARAAVSGLLGDYAQPLGLTPNLLVVGPSNESAGRSILNSELRTNDAGTAALSNEWKGTAELLVVPWLA